MSKIKFYEDANKQNQVYPEIDPNSVLPNARVGLADNLTSPDGITDADTFVFRTSGGNQDISDGYATLHTVQGVAPTLNQTLNRYCMSFPKIFKSIGLNQFNKNDEDLILSGKKIDSNGDIVDDSDYSVLLVKCVANQTYTITSLASGIVGDVGIATDVDATNVTILNIATTATSGQATVNDSFKKHVTTTLAGYLYITVDTTNIGVLNALCVHLTWSGYHDGDIEAYTEDNVVIPYRDKDGEVISNTGLGYINSTYYDEIDLAHKRYYKRVASIEYTPTNLDWVVNESGAHAYIYDSAYIYYDIDEVVYDLTGVVNEQYRVSDFGTEQFITDEELNVAVASTVTMTYQTNLKDKLRRQVEVIDHKVTSVNSSSTDVEYPTAKALYDLITSIRHLLGVDVDTFSTSSTYSIGDYVIYNYKLYVCKQDILTPGPWTGSIDWDESYIFKS